MDTGVFDEDRYFDVVVEYAKASPEDLLIRISATNRGPEPARLHLLPTVWFRNTWSWTKEAIKPRLAKGSNGRPGTVINIDHPAYGRRYLYLENKPSVLFTENETNSASSLRRARPSVLQGRHQRFRRERSHRRREQGGRRHQGRARLPFHRRARRDRDREAAAHRPGMAGGERSAQRRVRSRVHDAQAGGRRVLRRGSSPTISPTTRRT